MSKTVTLKALASWNALALGERAEKGKPLEVSPARARVLIADGRAEKPKPKRKTKKQDADA